MNCVRRTYAMQAASSPKRCTCGFKIVVLIALQFLPNTKNTKIPVLLTHMKLMFCNDANFTIFKVELVKVHAFDQVTQRLRFKCSQMWIANFSNTHTKVYLFLGELLARETKLTCTHQSLRY